MSSLFNQASLVLVPSGYKAGKVYSQVPTNGDGDLTFTRASSATRVNSDGEIEVVGSGVPRLDYSQGSCPALLLEPQRTNLCLYSQDFNGSGWTFLGSTKVSTTQTDPSGGNTALNVTWGSGGGGYFYRNQTGLTIGATYTITFYVRSTNNSTFRLYSESLAFSSANFTATSTFQRFTLSYTANQTSGTFGLRGATTNAAADLIVAFAQFEVGAYATSYIPTTSATVTRLRDRCIKTNFTGLSSQSELTLYAEFVYNQGGRIIAIGNGTASNRLFVASTSTKQIQLYLNVGGTVAFFLTSANNVLLNGKNKVAVKIKSGETLLYVNGVEIFNNTTTFTLANMSNIYIGTGEFSDLDNNTQEINSSLIFYSALTNSELASLTTL